jgi:hypothetical protein
MSNKASRWEIARKRWNRTFIPTLLLGLILGLGALPPDPPYRYPFASNDYAALSGTFGELRGDHFHSGIDIKTWGKRGIPLYAIQEGYIYRIKVGPYGFGRAIYLRHPDGRFSVYGHMQRFTEEIEAFVYERQYTSKQAEQEIYLGQNEWPVKAGELIGYSGNSGSSFGPHLHFEIRDPQERILNPLRWYKDRIADHKPPILQAVGIEPIKPDARVAGKFEKRLLTPQGGNGRYRLPGIIKVRGKVGIEYQAYDLLDAAGNPCGINHARLFLDDELVYLFELDRYAFDEKRYIYVHIDHAHYQQTRQRLQKAYVDFGNQFPAYKHVRERGMIELTDLGVHEFRLELEDLHGNRSVLTGQLQHEAAPPDFPDPYPNYGSPRVSHEVKRGNLVVTVAQPARSYFDPGLRYTNQYGREKLLKPAYYRDQRLVFILPLSRFDYPVRVYDDIGNIDLPLYFKDEVLPGKNTLVEVGQVQAFFPYQAVFDRVHLEVEPVAAQGPDMLSPAYRLGTETIPLFRSFLVSFKPNQPRPLTHLVVAKKEKGTWRYAGNTHGEDGNVYASTREFGVYCLMADSTAPDIRPVNFGQGATVGTSVDKLVLTAKDAFSGIDHETVYGQIDGEWKLFSYDFRDHTLTYQMGKERPAPGQRELLIEVKDKAGNLATARYRLIFR